MMQWSALVVRPGVAYTHAGLCLEERDHYDHCQYSLIAAEDRR